MESISIYAHLTALSVVAILIATPALAQQTIQNSASPPAAMEQPQTNTQTDGNATFQPAALKDKPVWSSDGQQLGAITKVNLGPNGDVESIYVNVGAVLGLGGKNVMIEAAKFNQTNDRVELKMSAEEAKALPEIKA